MKIRLLVTERDLRPQYHWIAKKVVLCPALTRYQSQLWCYICPRRQECEQAAVTRSIPLEEVMPDPTVLKNSITAQTILHQIRPTHRCRKKRKSKFSSS